MTITLLHIDCSPMGDNSVSRQLSGKIVKDILEINRDVKLLRRDLDAAPMPHLSADVLSAFAAPADQRDEDQKKAVLRSDLAVDELIAADIVVIGVPMWNFGLPSVLKSWVDHVARSGRTFRYTPTGPVGLLDAKKKVVLASARGGIYSTNPVQDKDHQESYLRTVFDFMGVNDISIIRAEGMGMGPEVKAKAVAAAMAEIPALVRRLV